MSSSRVSRYSAHFPDVKNIGKGYKRYKIQSVVESEERLNLYLCIYVDLCCCRTWTERRALTASVDDVFDVT